MKKKNYLPQVIKSENQKAHVKDCCQLRGGRKV